MAYYDLLFGGFFVSGEGLLRLFLLNTPDSSLEAIKKNKGDARYAEAEQEAEQYKELRRAKNAQRQGNTAKAGVQGGETSRGVVSNPDPYQDTPQG